VSKEVAAQHEVKAKEDAHHRAAAALQEKKAKLDALQQSVSAQERSRQGEGGTDCSTTTMTPLEQASLTSCTNRQSQRARDRA